MSKMVRKKPAKEVKKLSTQKYRFELSPSKIPLDYKRLWDAEDKLMESFTVSDITGLSYHTLLSKYYTYYSMLYNSSYLWLDYSYFLYYTYEVRSISCYLDVRNIEFITEVYNDCIGLLYNDLLLYYKEVLLTPSRNIQKVKLKDTCVWFIYHLNRANANNCLGVKASCDKNFYSNFQKGHKVSGRVVQKLIEMLEYNDCIYKFRGYSLKEDVTNKDGKKVYSGDTKRATTLLVFTGEKIHKYFHKSPMTQAETKKCSPLLTPNDYVEVRVKSKSKEVINKEDYPMEWLDKVQESEIVMMELQKKLMQSTVEVGGYLIPELLFRRIWIGDLSNYGWIHDNGCFQTKSKAMRKTIIIDGLPTKTIDLSSIHPRYLYSIEGIELPEDFDPYPQLKVKVDQKRINKFKKFYGLVNYNPVRGLAKITLLILLNASNRFEAKSAILSKLRKDAKKGMTPQEGYMSFIGLEDIDIDSVIDQILAHNKPISKYFATGASGMLMNKDSDIIVEALNCLIQLDVAALPLHDSVTVREDCVNEAIIALKQGYKKTVGSLINFKYEIE